MHVATCSSFGIDLDSKSPHSSTCLRGHHTANQSHEDEELLQHAKNQTIASKLDPRGYM